MDQQPIPLRGRQAGASPATGGPSPARAMRRPTAHPGGPAPRATIPAPSTGVPALPARYVARDRLLSLFDAALEQPLTLVSAPAGTGKTVATAAWTTEVDAPVVWVTISQADLSGPGVWGLLIEELHHHGVSAGSPLPGPGSLAYDRVFLYSLATQLARRLEPLVLVIDSECNLPGPIAAGLHYLVQHGAGKVHLLLLTRQEPPLPLWHYRLAGTISELHMSDLAFSEREAAQLLLVHGVVLREEALDELMRRTHGWAVGLTLAAQVLASHPDPDSAVREVRGDAGAVADYLLTEIVDTHPSAVRTLMLQTSVADPLRPGLVEVLAGRRGPRALHSLGHRNALIEQVQEPADSYRYHPLLRQLLRSRLRLESPGRAAELERSAAAWMAEHGFLEDAVAGAAARMAWAEASGYAVDALAVVELLEPAPGALAKLFADMPDSAPGTSAALVRAATCLADEDVESSRLHLARADRLAAPGRSRSVRAAHDLIRLALAARDADPQEMLHQVVAAERSLGECDGERLAGRPEIATLLSWARADAQSRLGDLAAASRALATGPPSEETNRCPALSARHRSLAALVAAWRGELGLALELAEATPQAARGSSSPPTSNEVAIAWVASERCDGTMTRLLQVSHVATPPDHPLAWGMLALARSRVRRDRSEVQPALTELADPRLAGLPDWLAARLRIETAAVQLAAGADAEAVTMLRGDENAAAEESLLRARLALASGTPSESSAEMPGEGPAPLGTRVSAELLRTAVLLRQGEQRQAVGTLNRSLRLAAPERLRRPFQEAPTEVRRLLGSQRGLAARHAWLDPEPPSARTERPATPPLVVEPLTEREREVLALLADLLTTEEIASSLFVSVNTVRTHVRSILRKLGATRRNEAIRRARALRILPGQPTDGGITRYG